MPGRDGEACDVYATGAWAQVATRPGGPMVGTVAFLQALTPCVGGPSPS